MEMAKQTDKTKTQIARIIGQTLYKANAEGKAVREADMIAALKKKFSTLEEAGAAQIWQNYQKAHTKKNDIDAMQALLSTGKPAKKLRSGSKANVQKIMREAIRAYQLNGQHLDNETLATYLTLQVKDMDAQKAKAYVEAFDKGHKPKTATHKPAPAQKPALGGPAKPNDKPKLPAVPAPQPETGDNQPQPKPQKSGKPDNKTTDTKGKTGAKTAKKGWGRLVSAFKKATEKPWFNFVSKTLIVMAGTAIGFPWPALAYSLGSTAISVGKDIAKAEKGKRLHYIKNNRGKIGKKFAVSAAASAIGFIVGSMIDLPGLFNGDEAPQSPVMTPANTTPDMIENITQPDSFDTPFTANQPAPFETQQLTDAATQAAQDELEDELEDTIADHLIPQDTAGQLNWLLDNNPDLAGLAPDLIEAAQNGDSGALRDAGIGLINGWYGFDDLTLPEGLDAKEWGAKLLGEAAATGDEWAQSNYAYLQYHGLHGVPMDRDAALETIRASGRPWIGGEALLNTQTTAPEPTIQPEPVTDPDPEPAVEPVAEPVTTPDPEPVATPDPEPVTELEPTPEPAPTIEFGAAPEDYTVEPATPLPDTPIGTNTQQASESAITPDPKSATEPAAESAAESAAETTIPTSLSDQDRHDIAAAFFEDQGIDTTGKRIVEAPNGSLRLEEQPAFTPEHAALTEYFNRPNCEVSGHTLRCEAPASNDNRFAQAGGGGIDYPQPVAAAE